MKKSNEIELTWIKMSLAKLNPSVTSIAAEYASELFQITPPIRARLSSESHIEFLGFFLNELQNHVAMYEGKIDFTADFIKFKKVFGIE